MYHFGHRRRDASAFVLDLEWYLWQPPRLNAICEAVRAPAAFCLNCISQHGHIQRCAGYLLHASPMETHTGNTWKTCCWVLNLLFLALPHILTPSVFFFRHRSALEAFLRGFRARQQAAKKLKHLMPACNKQLKGNCRHRSPLFDCTTRCLYNVSPRLRQSDMEDTDRATGGHNTRLD